MAKPRTMLITSIHSPMISPTEGGDQVGSPLCARSKRLRGVRNGSGEPRLTPRSLFRCDSCPSHHLRPTTVQAEEEALGQ